MDNFNRTISFVLGLVVVVVFLAVISGRINLRNRLTTLTKSGNFLSPAKPSPTPTKNPNIISHVTIAPTRSNYQTNNYQSQTVRPTNSQNPKTIPSTGSPTILIPLAVSTLMVGIRLRKKLN